MQAGIEHPSGTKCLRVFDAAQGDSYLFLSALSLFFSSSTTHKHKHKHKHKLPRSQLFFANERTFIHWLHMGVVLSGVASGVLAFSGNSPVAEWYGIMLLPVSLGFCAYALHTFLWRAERIKLRIPGRWDDPLGPVLLATFLAVVLAINFFMNLFEILKEDVEEIEEEIKDGDGP